MKLEWKKINIKEVWKHTRPIIYKNKKKYNRSELKRNKTRNYKSGEEGCEAVD